MPNKNLTRNLNNLQPTNFKVIIDRERFSNIEFFAQTINHPFISKSAIDVPFRDTRALPSPNGALEYGQMGISFILDEQMFLYDELYNWLLRLNSIAQNGNRIPRESSEVGAIDEGTPLFSDITLLILSNKNNISRQIRYHDAWPTLLDEFQLATTGDGLNFITFSANFRFTRFELLSL